MAKPSAFPPVALKEARLIAKTIAEKNAGRPMRRLDVFHELGKSPDSGASRNLVTSSSGFGLTNGGYQAETLSLTELGKRLAVDGDETASIDAVLNVEIFKAFFEAYKDRPIPAAVAGRSFLAERGIQTDRTQACLDRIFENGRAVGLIEQIAGTERVLSREHALEKKPSGARKAEPKDAEAENGTTPSRGTAELTGRGSPTGVLPSLNINLEIHLPDDATPEVYDAIFSSMRRHLIDAGQMAST